MTDILIRGMEMPKSCGFCELRYFDGDSDCCPFVGDACEYGTRPPDCPIHELQPHGDLIDRDEIKTNMIDEVLGKTVSYVNMEQIKNAPVIVPSNKEDTP